MEHTLAYQIFQNRHIIRHDPFQLIGITPYTVKPQTDQAWRRKICKMQVVWQR
jgi:hypothetical protein